MQEVIMSVGIDIGTSTTQLIFSRLTIENLASSYTVPRISIVDKTVIYRSEIYFTPLLSDTEIDAEGVKRIVQKEYAAAGIKPEELKTGAVIITGETARKENANAVLKTLSDMAGDFVVATAGPDLESVLSAKGAGTDVLSEKEHLRIVNLDIGGGTSNLAVFDKGKLSGTACLDIGGRLIKVDGEKITYIFPKIKALAEDKGIHIAVGDAVDVQKLQAVSRMMADHLAQAIGTALRTPEHRALYTNSGEPLKIKSPVDGVTFSGGVADYIYHPTLEDPFRYGDIGILLGQAVAGHEAFQKIPQFEARETIRATVVGAGSHTTNVSGSTIRYVKEALPIKNIPILKISEEDERQIDTLRQSILDQMPLYRRAEAPEQLAIAFSGADYSTFAEVQILAAGLIAGAEALIGDPQPLIIIVENDIGKVLGNALNVLLHRQKAIICLDGIYAQGGDYIDIGESVAGGRVVPVVIKTLVFNA